MNTMTTHIPVSFTLCGVSCEACARMVSEQKDGHTTQQYFVITVGDYIMAKWVPGGPLEFENRSAANYHESNVLCQLNEVHMRTLILPALFSFFCPENSVLSSRATPLPANTSYKVAPGEIEALPPHIRSYVHQLETRSDPAGDIQRIAALEQQVKGLTTRVATQEHLDLVTLATGALTGLCSRKKTEEYDNTLAHEAVWLARKTRESIVP